MQEKYTSQFPALIRDRQVKEAFGISPTQARRLSQAGILKRHKIGGVAGYFYDEAVQALRNHAE